MTENNIKIAYCVMAHKDAGYVNRLITALNYNDTDFYVHIDSKSDILKNIEKKDNVYFTTERINVKWGHISQVEAIRELLKTVKASGKIYDYVWLISGQDYPIKSNEYIHNFLSDNRGYNFINIGSPDDAHYPYFLKRNETWYPMWYSSQKFIVRIWRKIYKCLTGGMKRSFFKRKNPFGGRWYFGSEWFAITMEAMNYVLQEMNSKPYFKFYKNTICPDESMIHTIVGNSPYADTVKDCLLYVDWSEGRKNPKILNADDYEKLLSSDKLIARKFERIDKKILQLSAQSKA